MKTGDDDRLDRESLIDSVGLPDELLDGQNVRLVLALAEGATYTDAAISGRGEPGVFTERQEV